MLTIREKLIILKGALRQGSVTPEGFYWFMREVFNFTAYEVSEIIDILSFRLVTPKTLLDYVGHLKNLLFLSNYGIGNIKMLRRDLTHEEIEMLVEIRNKYITVNKKEEAEELKGKLNRQVGKGIIL